jgi:hypothetical protein
VHAIAQKLKGIPSSRRFQLVLTNVALAEFD